MEQRVNDKNKLLVEQQELTCLRDLELQHLKLRLRETEAAAEAAKRTEEATAEAATQIDSQTPASTGPATEVSADLSQQHLHRSAQGFTTAPFA